MARSAAVRGARGLGVTQGCRVGAGECEQQAEDLHAEACARWLTQFELLGVRVCGGGETGLGNMM
jgi:hypothetical protein